MEPPFNGGDTSSAAGALLLGAPDRRIGFDDAHVQAQVDYTVESREA